MREFGLMNVRASLRAGARGAITAIANCRCNPRRFMAQSPLAHAGIDSLSGLRRGPFQKREYGRPTQARSGLGPPWKLHAHRVSKPGGSRGDRGYLECTSRTWNGRRYGSEQLAPESRY